MWEINVTNQIITFVLSLCLGASICMLYDIIRALHKAGLNSFFAVFFTDIIFWIICAFLTFIFLISRTNGEIRGYVLCGELLGFAAVRVTASKIIYWLLSRLFTLVVKLKKYAYNKINTLMTVLWNVLSNNMKLFLHKFKTVLKRVKKLLKNKGELLYTNKNTTNAENVLDETETKT